MINATRNIVLCEKSALRMVDDFALSSEKPTPGAWHFLLTLGELPPMPITLCAAAEEMKKLWYAHTAAYRKSAMSEHG